MELEQLLKLAKNLHDHFHLKGKTSLTQDEYRLCESLLSHRIDVKGLYRGLAVINNEIQFMGPIRMSNRD